MKKLFTLLMSALVSICASAQVYNMKELGADPTGKNKCTQLINQTIAKAAANGGGTLYFPAGTYLTGAIHMQSHITLNIEGGAVIRFSDEFNDYLPFIKVRWEGVFMQTFAPLINAQNAENITITGRGTLDGQGLKWWQEGSKMGAAVRSAGQITSPNELNRMWQEANKDLEVADYYKRTLARQFFRPPFIQFLECKNIRIEGVTIKNSPFWTINPVMCDDLVVHGVTISNPTQNPKGPNTDGINPSSCRNVRISDCFISVGDDCITIKSGRDAEGRKYGRPCENITITNCVMLSGHGGVVIGSEMSGGVRKVAISNCVFNGTDNGIRLKSSRGRGGVVEDIRVDNIVMNGITGYGFIFNLMYDKQAKPEPVSERTPIFRNIHISNVTGTQVKRVGHITGIEEMPVRDISFSNIQMAAEEGFNMLHAEHISLHRCDWSVAKGPSLRISNSRNIILDDVRSKKPLPDQPVIEVSNAQNILVNNCFQVVPTDIFMSSEKSEIIWGNNFMNHVKTARKEK